MESPRDGRRELILLSVTPDRAPSVKIEQPARDLLLADTDRHVQVKISASDDLGLRALELRYTKISGAGEQFEFQEGTLPIRLERGTVREWRADGAIALRSLALMPGDAVIYRAVAMDRRPGEGGTEYIRHVLHRDRRPGTGSRRRGRHASWTKTATPFPSRWSS